MANYANLKSAIQQVIKTNGNNEITGALLQQSLLAMINSLGGGYQYMGIATPTTNPGTPDQNVFYLASNDGIYANFGGLVLSDGEIAILKYNGAWSKDSTGAASQSIILNKHFKGAGDNKVESEINVLHNNTGYFVEFNSDWSCNELTIASSYAKFYINSVYNGVSTAIISYNLNAEIPKKVFFTVPTNSDYIVVGIRANNNADVLFSINRMLNFSPYVYFSNEESPLFEFINNAIKVTLKGHLNIYDSVSGVKVFGSSAYNNVSFDVPAGKRLVFDYQTSTIKLANFEEAGEYIDMFSVYGSNCLSGLLTNYYYNSVINSLKEKIGVVRFVNKSINFYATPWTYSNSSIRVSTDENNYFKLNKGDRITLTNYTGVQMYIGWKVGNTYNSTFEWLSSDFICRENGEYAIVLKYTDDRAVPDPNTLASLVNIIPNYSIFGNDIQAIDLNVLNPDLFEIGNISISTVRWTYNDLSSRVRLKENSNLFLNAGDIIKLTDYSFAEFYVGYRKNGVYYSSGQWLKNDFICPMDAEYTVLLEHPYGTAKPLSDKWQLLSLLRIQRGKESVIDIAKSHKYSTEWLLENDNVVAANHRGYCTIAPENTIPAFKLSSEKGFKYIELDVQFTSDGVPVILHDETINRTSNGTGAIAGMTYAQVSQYDFGSWKSSEYTGTKIPTFEEVLQFAKQSGLKIYVELKTLLTDEQATLLGNLIKKYGMKNACIFFGSNILSNEKMGNIFPKAKLGYSAPDSASLSDIENALTSLKAVSDDVFLCYSCFSITNELEQLCIGLDVELVPYGVRSYADYQDFKSVTGILIDSIIPEIYKS